jgi:hypothetical protein
MVHRFKAMPSLQLPEAAKQFQGVRSCGGVVYDLGFFIVRFIHCRYRDRSVLLRICTAAAHWVRIDLVA